MKNLAKRIVLGAAVVATTLSAVGVGAASAGEIKGTYKNPNRGVLEYIAGDEETPLKARSICAYSGLDEPDALNLDDGDDFLFGQTQNYGQVVRFFGNAPGGASSGCNPNSSSEE